MASSMLGGQVKGLDAAGTEWGNKRAPGRIYEARETVSNMLCSTIASNTVLWIFCDCVDITRDQQ